MAHYKFAEEYSKQKSPSAIAPDTMVKIFLLFDIIA
jgi:transposase